MSPPLSFNLPGNATATQRTADPYARGLAGVNLEVNDYTSNALYGSLGLILAAILLVRLAQRAKNYLRQVTNLDTSHDGQRFWSEAQSSRSSRVKKALLYAPLGRKRHNREVQLSSAVNVGTVPGRLHTTLLAFYLLTNLMYCLILDYRGRSYDALVAEVRGRTGHLAVMNMLPLFLLAGRNNPLIRLLRVSFDTFNLFHRWIGRIVVIETCAHVIAWSANMEQASGSGEMANQTITTDPFLLWGLIGTIAFAAIFFQAPSAIRHAFYETFLHIHQFLALIGLVGVFAHVKLHHLPQLPLCIAIVLIWSWDRLMRWARILYHNYSFSTGWTRVAIEALPSEACRVTFELPRPWKFRPGAHVYVYLPSISFWMSHPFSIAWQSTRDNPILEPTLTSSSPSEYTLTDDKPGGATAAGSPDDFSGSRTTTTVSLIIAARTGMTRELYNRAKSSPTGKIRLRGAIEGPYAGHDTLDSYGTVVLFAGGVGITHQLGHIRALLEARENRTCATRKVHLVWSVRSKEQLEWVKPWMDEILQMPRRREMLSISIWVSQPKDLANTNSARIRLFPGRARPRVVLERECRERTGAMTVGVCGPGALADEVRLAVRQCLGAEGQHGVIDFWEEAFTW